MSFTIIITIPGSFLYMLCSCIDLLKEKKRQILPRSYNISCQRSHIYIWYGWKKDFLFIIIGKFTYPGEWEFEAPQIGHVFNRHYWIHGHAVESCCALIQQAFANGVHRIYAECEHCNMRFWKLLETSGFRKEACFRKKRINPLHYSSIPYHLARKPSSVFVICRDRYASASPVSAWPPNS